MNKLLSIVLFTLPFAMLGQKKEIETTASITDVTVYTAAAEINYEKEIILPKGKSTVVFNELTPFIVENSVNVSVSNSAVSIVTVAERINYAREKKNINEQVTHLQDSIAKMARELGLLKCKRDVMETEKGLLFKGEAIGGLSTHGVSVAEIEKASAFFNRRYLELSRELFFLTEKEKILTALTERYYNQIEELETISIQTTSEIRVTVSCPAEEKTRFKFKFLTAKAGWTPVYDFKYEGPGQPLQFIFRANIFNASGIAWQDVSLKLSTADPMRGFKLPEISEEQKKDGLISKVQFKQSESVNAITEYTIAQQYSIPSDAKSYWIDVNAASMPAAYNYLLIPKLDPFGFLMAKIPNWNKYNLIPGESNIYNMGSYMGKTFLNTYAQNDTLSLYLGKDKNIQANRTEKNILHSRFLAGNYTVEENNTTIQVKNNFTNSLPIEIVDQVPIYTKDDKEKMTVSGIGNALYEKADGMLYWTFIIKSGETININYKYEIKAPKEFEGGDRFMKKKFRTVSCPRF